MIDLPSRSTAGTTAPPPTRFPRSCQLSGIFLRRMYQGASTPLGLRVPRRWAAARSVEQADRHAEDEADDVHQIGDPATTSDPGPLGVHRLQDEPEDQHDPGRQPYR